MNSIHIGSRREIFGMKHSSTVPALIDFGGAEDYPLYTNEVQRYPRAPHIFIGFPSRYMKRKVWTDNVAALPNRERHEKLCKVHPPLWTDRYRYTFHVLPKRKRRFSPVPSFSRAMRWS